jgi:hypothetical protein
MIIKIQSIVQNHLCHVLPYIKVFTFMDVYKWKPIATILIKTHHTMNLLHFHTFYVFIGKLFKKLWFGAKI